MCIFQRAYEIRLQDLVCVFGMADFFVCFCGVGAGCIEKDIWAARVVADVGGYVVYYFVNFDTFRSVRI